MDDRVWLGRPSISDAYAAWMIQDRTYLYECFDLATPASFLENFARVAYLRRDPHFFISTIDGTALVRERDGYVERTVSETIDRLVTVWYAQCERVCSMARETFEDVHGSIQSTITYPKMRSRLDAKIIRDVLGRLRFQFAHEVDVDLSKIVVRRILQSF